MQYEYEIPYMYNENRKKLKILTTIVIPWTEDTSNYNKQIFNTSTTRNKHNCFLLHSLLNTEMKYSLNKEALFKELLISIKLVTSLFLKILMF